MFTTISEHMKMPDIVEKVNFGQIGPPPTFMIITLILITIKNGVSPSSPLARREGSSYCQQGQYDSQAGLS